MIHYSPLNIDAGGGSFGRLVWHNSDTRCVASSWVFWGGLWWDTTHEKSEPLPELDVPA